MQYHIDREILLKKESECKSLYSWYLQEFSENKAASNKFIPWGKTLDFNASELKLVKRVETKRYNIKIEGDDNAKNSSSEYIQAIIRPEGSDFLAFYSAPKYSMFGTDREIKEFTLTIRELENNSESEKCICWGIVSYTAEIDFRDFTTSDAVGFEVWLNSKNYNDLRQFAFNKFNDDTLKLSIKGSGFYSEWSPTASTDYIKVLAEDSQQEVKKEIKEVDAPHLGKIGDFSLCVIRKNVLAECNNVEEDLHSDFDKDESMSIHNENSRKINDLLVSLAHTQASIRKLYLPIWVIVILLFLILLK